MKIQINSLEILQKLIDEDDNMKIAIKESIVNQFAKQYLKSVVSDEIIKDLKKDIVKEIKESGYFGLKDESSIYGNIKLTEEVKALIKKSVFSNIDKFVSELVAGQYDTIKASIKEKTEYFIKDEILKLKNNLEENQRKLIQEEIKNVLKSLK